MPDLSAAVVFLSCDKAPYTEALPVAQTLLKTWWPDRRWPIHTIVASARSAREPGASGFVIHTGTGVAHWGAAVAKGCGMLTEEWLLLVEDDYFATARWDTDVLDGVVVLAAARGAQYARVCPTPGPSENTWRGGGCGVHVVGDPYRFSLQACWVRREYLARCAKDFDNPWDFELGQPGDLDAEHLSVERSVRPVSYTEALKRGKATEDGRKACEAVGIAWPWV